MKTFIHLSLLLFGLLQFSCGVKEGSDYVESKIVCTSESFVVFTGDQIQWLNEKTGELRFIPENIWSTKELFMPTLQNSQITTIKILIGDEELFTLVPIDNSTYVQEINEPTLLYTSIPLSSIDDSRGKFYIRKGYPSPAPDDEAEKMRDENWNKIQSGWGKFIAQLQAEGRYKK